LHNTAFNLVDIFETTTFHKTTQNFTTDTASTVGHNLLDLKLIIFATFKFWDKVTGCISIWDYGIFEFTNLGLVRIAAIKEHNIITVFFNKFMYLLWFEVFATANYALFINLYFVRDMKTNYFFTS